MSRKNKILVLVIALLGYCVFGLSACEKKEIKNVSSNGKNIICFGDSITYGYGVTSDEAYPVHLSKMINFSVINAGIDGDTTTEALKRLDSDVLSRNPLLVIIEFGGNDFLRKVSPELTVNNIKQMVERIQEKGAMVAIVDVSAGMLMKEYRPAYFKIAKDNGAIFVPSIMSGIITNPSMKSDFLHPNGNGYKLIAQRILKKISPYLNHRQPSTDIKS
ncbi:MAG: arylesterase [Candidatus Omnitrophica bacterium]|nr:arylesterase [Candidatus Omnitrophota bacterium]